jgi:hypothetical protein
MATTDNVIVRTRLVFKEVMADWTSAVRCRKADAWD